MPKLLASAEAFGFGPPSKLHAICAEFARRGFENHFVGHDVALTFVQSNQGAFASITPVRSMSELAGVSPDGFDAAVSVMDPFLVVWASLNDVPCVYVDSLFWFWRWPPEEAPELRRMLAEVRDTADVTAALRYLDTVPMHATQYIAHHLSTVTCAQRSPGTMDRAAPAERPWRVEVVDAIVDLTHRAERARDTWLATASGILNPLMPVEPALQWLRVATGLIDEAIPDSSDEQVLLAGNPEVLDRAADILPDRIRPTPLDHGGILRAMNSAIACLTPPGLTTILECAAYGAPVILLPEQHYGHLRNYRELSRCGPAGAFPQALLNTRVARQEEPDFLVETQSILEKLTRHFEERDEVWSRMVAATADGMAAVRRDSTVHARQAVAVGEFAGGYAGVEQIANVLTKLLQRAGARG